MWIEHVILTSQWVFILYFFGLGTGYLTLGFISFFHLRRYTYERALECLPHGNSGFEPQISLLVPACNEQDTIVDSVRSLLQLSYSEYEIVVINDGSKDRTLDVLIEEFSLKPFPEAYARWVSTKPIRKIYFSEIHQNLRVVDKENGGKADSLNAGLNISRYPLFCCIDADCILHRDTLKLVVQPFLYNPLTVACGGTVRIANGCETKGGFLGKIGLPTKTIPLIQVVEYLRSFLFERLGWSPFNAMLIISGAFGLFHKETVIEIGGYRTDTIGEDMELVVRLHRHFRLKNKPYSITFVPDPVCWTRVPERLRSLKTQRIRWQRGLYESLAKNWGLLFHPKGGVAGWLAFPFLVVFEGIGPVIEVFGYSCLVLGLILGIISFQNWLILVFFAIGVGILLSVSALLLEEISFHSYSHPRYLIQLLSAIILENLGYRQLNSIWRLTGLLHWIVGKKTPWGNRITNKSSAYPFSTLPSSILRALQKR